MKIDKSSFTPLYHQIANILREEILKGRYKPNELLPSESQLMRQYSVSRGTVRDAIKLLLSEGLLTRHRGKGTLVTLPKIEQNLIKLMSFTELMQSQGKVPRAKVIRVESHQPTSRTAKLMRLDQIAELLKVKADDKILFVERLRLGDEEPLVLERSYFPEQLCHGLLDYDLEAQSIYTVMEEKLGITLGYAEQSIEAAVANSTESMILGIKIGSPMLLVKRLAYTVEGVPIEYAEDLHRGDRLKFSISSRRRLAFGGRWPDESFHLIKPAYSVAVDEKR